MSFASGIRAFDLTEVFMGTKERILLTSLCLFAKHGYEAVSVSMISGELGMTKGALYKHFKNKQDIFDCIVARMFELDAQRSKCYEVPEHEYEENLEEYKEASMEGIRKFTLAQLRFWTEDDFASNFRRMLSLEQYRDPKMKKLYSDCITAGPVAYMKDVFSEMMKEGKIRKQNPELLALDFYAPLFLLIQMADSGTDVEHAEKLLEEHIGRFMKNYEVS